MEAHSMDLRKRVLAAYDEGMQTCEVAKRLSVSRSWARRIKQWRSEGRSIEPKPMGGSVPKLDEASRERLRGFVKEVPDATLAELVDRIEKELSIHISIGALWNTLRAMDLPLKKSR